MGVISFIVRSVVNSAALVVGVLLVLGAATVGIGFLSDHVGGPFEEAEESFEVEEIEEEDVEDEIIEEVNSVRSNNSAPPLQEVNSLTQMSRSHSDRMAEEGELAHDIGNSTATGRLRAAGCSSGAENVAQSWVHDEIEVANETYYNGNAAELAEQLVATWMNSESHRKAILSESYSATGVGVTITDEDDVYATQMFCM